MRIKDKIAICKDLSFALLGKRRRPIFSSWALTFRCPHRCAYCAIYERDLKELNTEECMSVLAELKKAGCRVISFTGGEPLLREDLSEIITAAKMLGFYTYLCTSASPAPDKYDFLEHIDCLNLSIDGPEEVHDSIRSKGSYQDAMKLLRKAGEKGIKTEILSVLSTKNLDCVDYLASFAKEHKVQLNFQPSTLKVLAGDKANPIAPLLIGFRRAVSRIISHKQKGAPIGNSLAALEIMRGWPRRERVECPAKKIFCYIQPDGSIKLCPRLSQHSKPALHGEIPVYLNKLDAPQCRECWCCQKIEASQVLSFRPEAILNAVYSI